MFYVKSRRKEQKEEDKELAKKEKKKDHYEENGRGKRRIWNLNIMKRRKKLMKERG